MTILFYVPNRDKRLSTESKHRKSRRKHDADDADDVDDKDYGIKHITIIVIGCFALPQFFLLALHFKVFQVVLCLVPWFHQELDSFLVRYCQVLLCFSAVSSIVDRQ